MAAITAGGLVAGATGRSGARSAGQSVGIDAPGQHWPTAAFDARNSGHNPSALAPTAEPSVEWTFSVSEDHVDGGEKDGGPGKITNAAATVVDGVVYVGDTGHGVHENYLYAIDAVTGELHWRFGLGVDGVRSTPTVVDGVVYVGNGDNQLTAIDAATGSEVFVVDVGQDTVNSYRVRHPTVVGETVYFGADRDDRLHAASLSDGIIRWSFDAGRRVRGAPVVLGDTVYITASRNGVGSVYAIDAATGQEAWHRQYGSNTSIGDLPPPVAGNGHLYVGDTRYGRVHALDPATGETAWSFETDDQVLAAPAVAGCAVYVATEGGTLSAIDGTSGEEQWTSTLAGAVAASPTVANGVVYVGDGAGQLHAIDATKGVSLWTQRLDGRISAAATPSAGRIFASGEETLYAIGGVVDDRRGSVEEATCAAGAEPAAGAAGDGATERRTTEPGSTTTDETGSDGPPDATATPGQPGFTIGVGMLGLLVSATRLATRGLDR